MRGELAELHCTSWEEPFGGSPVRSFRKTNREPEGKEKRSKGGWAVGPLLGSLCSGGMQMLHARYASDGISRS